LLSTGRSAAQATVLSREDEAVLLDTIQRALHLRAHARAVLTACAGPLAAEWHMSEVVMVLAAVASVVGGTGSPPLLAPAPVPTLQPRLLVQNYGQSVHLSLAAMAQGMPAAEAWRQPGDWGINISDRLHRAPPPRSRL
jgi:hypothetical protein